MMEVDPPPAPETPATPAQALPGDSFYAVDETAVDAQRQAKPWTQDATYFKRVAVSPAASTKMLAHAQRGCEAGVKAGGKPLEVMGLLLGYPDADASKRRLVVTDALPLPVTGFETSVVADDDNVVNYMIALSDLVEKTRKERLMGWYHSHPFDVDEDHDNCFFSSTDLSTQLSWQNAEDPQGNPFLAIVLDPLRSAAKNSAALAAFRAYPPAYTPPANQCPDGEICADDARRVEVWGSCWHRYYQLDLEYFMSNQARAIVDVLNRSHLWAKTLSESHREDTTDRVAKIADKLARAPGAQPPRAPRLGGYGGLDALGSGAAPSARADQAPLSKAADAASGVATEALHGQLSQLTKRHLLCGCSGFQRAVHSYLARKGQVAKPCA